MARTATLGVGQTQVLVIDTRPQDYVELAADSAGAGFLFQFATTASDALKLWRTAARSIWLVNVNLPDGSGCDLAAAIRARDPRSVVYLLSDEYDPADEIAARVCGAAMYLCKPADASWLPSDGPESHHLAHCA